MSINAYDCDYNDIWWRRWYMKTIDDDISRQTNKIYSPKELHWQILWANDWGVSFENVNCIGETLRSELKRLRSILFPHSKALYWEILGAYANLNYGQIGMRCIFQDVNCIGKTHWGKRLRSILQIILLGVVHVKIRDPRRRRDPRQILKTKNSGF